jgi:hypothetical protein
MTAAAAGLMGALVALSACESPAMEDTYDKRNTDAAVGISRITNTPFEQDRRDYFKDRGP